MKRIGLIMLFIAVLFSGCGSSGPKDVVVEFIDVFYNDDFKKVDSVKQYVLPNIIQDRLKVVEEEGKRNYDNFKKNTNDTIEYLFYGYMKDITNNPELNAKIESYSKMEDKESAINKSINLISDYINVEVTKKILKGCEYEGNNMLSYGFKNVFFNFNYKAYTEIFKQALKEVSNPSELFSTIKSKNEELYMSAFQMKVDKVNILKEDIEADTATVRVEVISEGKSIKIDFNLETIDGKWKIKSTKGEDRVDAFIDGYL